MGPSPRTRLPAVSVYEDELCGCIFEQITARDGCVELELRGLKVAPPASPVPERVLLVCSSATVLSTPAEIHALAALPDYRRQIDDALLLNGDTLYLAMTGGAGLLVTTAGISIHHCPA